MRILRRLGSAIVTLLRQVVFGKNPLQRESRDSFAEKTAYVEGQHLAAHEYQRGMGFGPIGR